MLDSQHAVAALPDVKNRVTSENGKLFFFFRDTLLFKKKMQSGPFKLLETVAKTVLAVGKTDFLICIHFFNLLDLGMDNCLAAYL